MRIGTLRILRISGEMREVESCKKVGVREKIFNRLKVKKFTLN